jgi:hypothetical protein
LLEPCNFGTASASATETYQVELRLPLAGEERPDMPASGEIDHSSTPGRSAQAAKRARQKANRARKQAEAGDECHGDCGKNCVLCLNW